MAYPTPNVSNGTAGSTYLQANGVSNYDVTSGNSTVFITSGAVASGVLASASYDNNGFIQAVGAAATTVTDSSGQPTDLIAGFGNAFIYYQGGGPATIDGGEANLFVGSAFDVTNPVTIYASNGEGAHSYEVGGNAGPSTVDGAVKFGTVMYGATDNQSASAILVSGTGGETQMFGGIGHTTMFGSGAAIQANFGAGTGQVFSDSTGATDTIFGGTGGKDIVNLGAGGSSFDDRVSGGDDKLNLTTGTTTVFGASGNGTAVGLFSSSATVAVGDAAGAEQIYGAAGTITLASGDTAQSAAAETKLLADQGKGLSTSTITITTTGGASNLVTVNDLQTTTIKFG